MNKKNISKELEFRLQSLDQKVLESIRIKQKFDENLIYPITNSDKAKLYFLSIAALQRSNSLIDTLQMLLYEKNFYSAVALPRLQMDSLLRLFGFFFVDRKSEYLSSLNNGGLAKFKCSRGEKLTDAKLHHEISKQLGFEWVSTKYKKYCEGIHLSDSLMYAPLSNINLADNSGTISINPRQDYLPEKVFIEIADDFCMITDALFVWIDNSWLCSEGIHDPT